MQCFSYVHSKNSEGTTACQEMLKQFDLRSSKSRLYRDTALQYLIQTTAPAVFHTEALCQVFNA